MHYYTTDEAARDYFAGRVTSGTLKNQCRAGVIRAEKKGRMWLIAEDELARYAREHLGTRVGHPRAAP